MRLVLDYDWAGQVFTALLITGGGVLIVYKLREFHRRGLERIRQDQKVWRECRECGWGDFDPGYFEEIGGENYCSLHR